MDALPLVVVQRALQRRVAWPVTVFVLLVLTYLLSIANNALALLLAVHWGAVPTFDWHLLFGGLDGCWLALIAFCAIHAVLDRYQALEAERARVREALALARDAELRALRYQLHPHFLFNTLNAISTLIAEQRGTDATPCCAPLSPLGCTSPSRSSPASLAMLGIGCVDRRDESPRQKTKSLQFITVSNHATPGQGLGPIRKSTNHWTES